MNDVVLIHSTGQGADGWERVVRALSERGQTAHAVELPSDPDLLAADYAELIGRQVGAIDAPIVLAHSGAGPLLPATARALRACHQVWLAAWVPDPEATFVQDTGLHAQAAFNPDWIGKDPTEDAAAAAVFLYHDCDEAALEWALRPAGSSSHVASRASGSRSRRRSRRPTSWPRTTERSGRSGSVGWRENAWGWSRSRSRRGIARMCRSRTGSRSSSSTLRNAR